MKNFLKKILLKLLLKASSKDSKIPVTTHYKLLQRGQFKLDTYRLELYDSDTNTRYVLRPTWNPVPFIVDELVKITWNMRDAIDIYSKFTKASAEVTKSGKSVFRAKVFKY